MGSERRRELEETLEDMRSELAESREQLAHARQENAELTDQLLARQEPTEDSADHEGDLEHTEHLAARVAVLESRLRSTSHDDGDPDHDPTILPAQLAAVGQQLAEAQQREAHLLAGSLRADRIVADAGLRLAELGEIADRAEQLETDLAETTRRYEAGRDALEQALARVDLLETDVSQAAVAHQRATTELTDALSTITGITERTEAAELEAQTTRDRVAELDDALAVAQLERDGARSELVRQMQEIEDLTATVTELTAGLDERERSVDMAETARIAADERARVAHDRVVTLEDEMSGANSQRDEAIRERDQAQEQVAGLEHEYAIALDGEADARSAARTAEGTITELGAELQDVRTQLASTHTQLDETQRERETELAALQAQVLELEAASVTTADALAEVEDRNRQIESDREADRQEVAELQTQLETAAQDLAHARTEMETVRRSAAATAEQTTVAATEAAEVGERLAAAEERALGAERLLVDFQNRLHEAEAREQEAAAASGDQSSVSDVALAELREQLAAASGREEEERSRAEGLLAELDEAHERLRTAEAEASSSPAADPQSDPGTDGDVTPELAELEDRLEQAEARARRAYAAAESAEAALRFKEGGGGSTDPHLQEENVRLRTQVAELTDRLGQLQRQS